MKKVSMTITQDDLDYYRNVLYHKRISQRQIFSKGIEFYKERDKTDENNQH